MKKTSKRFEEILPSVDTEITRKPLDLFTIISQGGDANQNHMEISLHMFNHGKINGIGFWERKCRDGSLYILKKGYGMVL